MKLIGVLTMIMFFFNVGEDKPSLTGSHLKDSWVMWSATELMHVGPTRPLRVCRGDALHLHRIADRLLLTTADRWTS